MDPDDPAPVVPGPQRLLAAVPDLLLALLFGLLLIDPFINLRVSDTWAGFGWRPLDLNHPAITAIIMIEVLFLIPQLTLTDIATRIRKRPPWWLVPPIAIGALLLAPGGMDAARVLWENQSVLLIPGLWSVFHRARQLWELPGQPAMARMRVRALTGGRANVGGLMVLLALATSLLDTLATPVLPDWFGRDMATRVLATTYFSACAYDAWRVGGESFARNPRPLLWFDWLGVRDVHTPI